MLISEIVTFFLYAISMLFLPEYFGKSPPLCSCVPVAHHIYHDREFIADR